jgi:hypothetical protein
LVFVRQSSAGKAGWPLAFKPEMELTYLLIGLLNTEVNQTLIFLIDSLNPKL